MTRVQWLGLAVLGILAVCVNSAHGCRYNVREVGFIDVGIDPYRLFVYTVQPASPNEVGNLQGELDVALADTNIRSELVTAGADVNHPASRFLSLHQIDAFPAAVLVSPDGQSRHAALSPGGRSLAEEVLNSPTRRQILEKAADSYGVVLLIEGPQQDRNAAAREAVSAAIAQTNDQLEYLPKPIAKGPEMVVLDRASLAREEMLLWTLGLKPQDVNEPHAAVFYGRGRWIGPLFKGETLTGENLSQVLSIIGADCECGLDHRWLQGTMLPARWDEELQQRAAASLGFDPESPVVKMEMVSIVRRGMGGFDQGEMPFGYREMEVGGDVPDSNAGQDYTVSMAEPSPMSVQSGSVRANVDGEEGGRGFGILVASLGGMVVLVAIASVVVVLKAPRV